MSDDTTEKAAAFHDRTLAGLAVLDAYIAKDIEQLRRMLNTSAEDEIVGGLVNVCRYLLGIVEAESGLPGTSALESIRDHSIGEITEPSMGP